MPKSAISKTPSNGVARDDIIATPRDRKKLYAANRRGSPNRAPDAPNNRHSKTLEPRALGTPTSRVAEGLNRRAKTLF